MLHRRLLHVPEHTGWEELMGIKAQTGGLKRVNRGTVTAPCSFTANHPDGGTMRVTIQVSWVGWGCWRGW